MTYMSQANNTSMIDSVLEEVAGQVIPSKDEMERVKNVSEIVLKQIKDAIEFSKFSPEIILGGSYARNTWLPHEADIDVFLRYPTNVNRKELEEDSYRISCKAFGENNLVIRYAEHPYTETYVDNVRVNIVPCYKVELGNWITAADRSPYHLNFVKENVKQTLDVRLLKKFIKCQGIYGAEIKVGGFSGYMCETLIYRYGSFKNLILNASKWRLPLIITDKDKVKEVKEKFRGDKIIITDPIDHNRNLGRALSIKSLAKFVLACRNFVKKPSKEHFIQHDKEIKLKDIESNMLLENVMILEFEHEKTSADILWGMLYRTLNHFTKQFNENNFNVARTVTVSDEKSFSAYIFLFETKQVSEYEYRIGPYVFDEENFEKFVSKNLNNSYFLWINDEGKICAFKKRNISIAKKLLEEILKDPIKYGASRKIVEALKKGKIYTGKEILEVKREEILKGVIELLEPGEKKYFG
ncbi:MAG: CCA tRNA nucleotidyltransferase [Nitrososphaeria archaeon]|nr:CCA tRNA nucleotidyltransferase [Nitrososphaeria archaeon]